MDRFSRFQGFVLLLKALLSPKLAVDLGKILRMNNVGGLVLDVAAGGSGSGPKILGEDTVALDISRGEIREAIGNNAKAQWICADAKLMPFRENSFDCEITFCGLMYIHGKVNKKQTLKELLRTLKKNGKIVLIEPVIEKEIGHHIIKFRIFNNGRYSHEDGFGILGKGIKQTPEFLKKIAGENNATIEFKQVNRYFVAVIKKP